MSTDRTDALLQLLSTLRGGELPDLERLEGATLAEMRDAEVLFAAGIQIAGAGDRRKAAGLAFLLEHSPSAATIEEAIAGLSPEGRREFLELMAEDE